MESGPNAVLRSLFAVAFYGAMDGFVILGLLRAAAGAIAGAVGGRGSTPSLEARGCFRPGGGFRGRVRPVCGGPDLAGAVVASSRRSAGFRPLVVQRTALQTLIPLWMKTRRRRV